MSASVVSSAYTTSGVATSSTTNLRPGSATSYSCWYCFSWYASNALMAATSSERTDKTATDLDGIALCLTPPSKDAKLTGYCC